MTTRAMPAYLLGIDLGTSSAKAALFEAESLRLAAAASREHPVYYPQPGFAEQNPDEWWQAVVHAVRTVCDGLDPNLVRGIGLAGQMHGLVCLGADRKPVHPAIIWADTRSSQEVAYLASLQGSFEATLPGPPAAGFAAASALWLSRQRPFVIERTQTVLCPKDCIRLRLTDRVCTDPSDAAGTWLFDVSAATWAAEVAARCGLRLEHLPPVVPSADVCGGLTRASAAALGLVAGTPVVTGCADLAAQALGHSIVDPGKVLVTVGSGGQVLSPLLSPQPDPEGRFYVFAHNLLGRWYAQAAILSGGLALRWLRDLLGWADHPNAYGRLSELAASVPIGAQGLIFLPYLSGERTPHMDPQATGVFLGLRLYHHAGHLARAVMEGVGFALKECLDLVAPDPAEIVLSGGITQSETWCQILADIWGAAIHEAELDIPRACLGSAILAGVGAGIYRNVVEVLASLPQPSVVMQPGQVETYSERYHQYQRLYRILKDEMHNLQSQGPPETSSEA